MTNLNGDLFPETFVPPDYSLALSYPQGAQFGSHFDSRYRWGEAVVGVCLGFACTIYFTQQKGVVPEEWKKNVKDLQVNVQTQKCGKICVEVTLPRRTVYIMHGPARLDWKHGIRMQTAKRIASFPPPPNWNPWSLRRSLTFRCTKVYSDAYLQHQLQLHPNDDCLQARWKQQKKFRPQHGHGDGKASDAELAKMRADSQTILNFVLQSPYRNMRFGDDTTGFHHGLVVASTNGHRLGGGGGGADLLEEDDDAELRAAIQLSLEESQQQQQTSTTSLSTTGGGGSAAYPISLDDNDSDENVDGKASGSKREAVVDPNEEKKRLRLARLARFETQK